MMGDIQLHNKRLFSYKKVFIALIAFVIVYVVGNGVNDDRVVYAANRGIISPAMEEYIAGEEESIKVSTVKVDSNVAKTVESVNQSKFYEVIFNEEVKEEKLNNIKGYVNYANVVTKKVMTNKPVTRQVSGKKAKITDKTDALSVVGMNNFNLQIKYGISEEDMILFEKIIQAEAGGQDMKGKILVANVILNRVHSSKFPNTLKGVILQRSGSFAQFSPVSNGRLWTVTVSKETKLAVRMALGGEDYSNGALYFMARSAAAPGNVTWFDRALTKVLKHGGHEFFK